MYSTCFRLVFIKKRENKKRKQNRENQNLTSIANQTNNKTKLILVSQNQRWREGVRVEAVAPTQIFCSLNFVLKIF